MKDKTYKEIMVRYTDNHTRGRYKLYKPETKRVIMSRDNKLSEQKNLAETINMFCNFNKEDLVPGI